MMRVTAAFAFLLVLLFSVPAGWAGAPAALPAAKQEAGFGGSWQTTFGRLDITVAADGRCEGRYRYDGTGGSIEGTVRGNTLTFTWEESNGSTGDGSFELGRDGRTFTGRWRNEGEPSWHAWQGTRLSTSTPPPGSGTPPPASTSFTGSWQTTFGRLSMEVAADGSQCQGTYHYSGNTGHVEGTVQGNRFTFEWDENDGQATGDGWFELSDDAGAFTGAWRSTGETEYSEWTGTRFIPGNQGEVGGAAWLIVLESEWDGGMDQTGYSWGEMLEAYFERCPELGFRHRFFQDPEDLYHWCEGMATLQGPKIVLIACHGSPEGLAPDRAPVGWDEVAEALALIPDLSLVHFSSCAVMGGEAPDRILAAYPAGTLTVSGYEVSVDWPHSAAFEFLYFDYIIEDGMTPREAGERVAEELSFARGSQEYSLHFRSVTETAGGR